MKLQLSEDGLRVRIDEAQLARLQAGDTLELALPIAAAPLTIRLHLHPAGEAMLQADAQLWALILPAADVAAHAARLPTRDALQLHARTAAGGRLAVAFEVDVRDSLRARGPRRRG